MKKVIVVSLAVSAFVLGGCGKQNRIRFPRFRFRSIPASAAAERASSRCPAAIGEPVERVTIPDAGFAFGPYLQPLGAAHQKYLDDQIEFKPVPIQASARGRTAVIDSTVDKFYPGAKLNSAADLAKLPKGEPIPIGTIIPVLAEIRDPTADTEPEGMFVFEETITIFMRPRIKAGKALSSARTWSVLMRETGKTHSPLSITPNLENPLLFMTITVENN